MHIVKYTHDDKQTTEADMSIKNYDFTDLEGAVADAATPPFGAWRVETEGDDIYLIWECKESDWPEDATGDEPWVEWSGDAIIKEAGIGQPEYAGTYLEDGLITHWACWPQT